MASWIRSLSSRRPFPLAAALLLLVGPGLVASPAPASAAKRRADPAEQAAKAEFKRGQTAYTLGRFEEALKAYSQAYELKPLAPFLFNIAQCHRQLGHFERAAFFYRRYLDTAPPGDKNAPMVQGLLEDAEQKLAEQKSREEADAEARRQAELEKARAEAARAEAKAAESRRAELEAQAKAAVTGGQAPAGGLISSSEASPSPAAAAEQETPVYEQWWLWTLVGVVVVGAAAGTAAYVATEPQPSSTSLGTLDAR